MRSILKTILLIAIMVSSLAFAKGVTVPSISVVEGVDNYNVILDTTGNVSYKKVNSGENSAYFEIENANIKENAPVLFENTKNLEGVTVQTLSGDKIKINIKKSEILNK